MKHTILLFLLLIGIGSAYLPSDEIIHIPPPKVIDLQHVNPAIPKLYADQNADLGAFREWDLPNFGHYTSGGVSETQEGTDLTGSQQAVLENVTDNSTPEDVIYL